MANGLMLCALTGSGAQSPKTARKQRSYIPPPPAWGSPNELDADVAAAMRPVSAYGALEMQARSRRDRAGIAPGSHRVEIGDYDAVGLATLEELDDLMAYAERVSWHLPQHLPA